MEIKSKSIFENKKIKELIESNDSIALFHHIEPDGDCIGSSRALYHLLKLNYPNKSIYWVGDDYGRFQWMEPMKTEEDNVDFDNTLAICVDVAPTHRVEKLELMQKCKKGIIRIDHHPSVCDYDPIATHLDVSSPATCQIVVNLINEFKWSINETIATYLYLGIMTDTSRFLYRSVSDKTYDAASFLYKNKSDRSLVHSNIYSKTREEIKLQSIILSGMKVEDGVAWFFINNDILKECNIKHDKAIMIEILGGIQGVKAWVMFNQYPDYIRTELRCNADYKINEVAFKFKGGGHEQASGCKLYNESDIKLVIKAVKELVK